jgi:hypothetical protein
MPHEDARYEYRAFAANFGIVEQRLRAAGGTPQIRESAEVYFVGRDDDTHNVKIRNGELDIKVLVHRASGLEQWDPKHQLHFPLADRTLAEVLAPSLAFAGRLPAGAGESPGRLTAALHAREDVVVVDLFKRRFGFLVEDCIAELADVTCNGAAVRTACVESTDLEQVLHVVAGLGLDAFPNVSYLTALRRMTGLAREPAF